MLRGSADLLEQVLTNLLHNAIKSTPKGCKISVNLALDGEKATCSISDTGIGISEENRIHIFERFYKRTDRGRARTAEAGWGSRWRKKS